MELVLGNIFIRPNILAKEGDTVKGHAHNFDHTTYVCRGSVRITRTKPNGDTLSKVIRSVDTYPFVMILAEDTHEIVALEDDTVFHCIYAHRTPQGEVTQVYEGWSYANE